MDRLRLPFFIIAVIAMALVVLVEVGSILFPRGHDAAGSVLSYADRYVDQASDATEELDRATDRARQAAEENERFSVRLPDSDTVSFSLPGDGRIVDPPGRAIPYLALVDVILLFTVAMMLAGILLPHKLHGRAQGVATIIAAIVLILTALVMLLLAILELILMVTLLFAFPFGTIAYLIAWGSFPRGDAALLLSLLMFLKLAFGVALVLAQQRFIQNKGLVLMVLTSVVCNIVAAFLHGLVPTFLVAIVDEIGAIIFAIVAIIWAIVLLIGAIPAVVKAVATTGFTPLGTIKRLAAYLLRKTIIGAGKVWHPVGARLRKAWYPVRRRLPGAVR